MVDFLISYAKELNIKSPIPKENVFHDISFYNTRNMEKRTEIIPDTVADEIYSKLQLLYPLHQLNVNYYAGRFSSFQKRLKLWAQVQVVDLAMV